MLKIKHLLWAFVLLTCGTSAAQTNLPFDASIKKGKLTNGLTYFIKQNKKPEKKVELRLVINAGSILEDDDQQGLAHMCEHMAFNGTTNFKKNDIVSYLQGIGVGFGNDLNAYTSFNETVYMLPIPTDKPGNLEKGFQVLEDWAHNVTYLGEDIDNERNIILEESRTGKGAEDRMSRVVYPVIFNGSKYAERLPIGKDSIIKNHQHNVIRRFYKDWYRPNLMAVIVVGDIDVATAEAMVQKHFSSLTNPVNERPRSMIELKPYAKNIGVVTTDKEAQIYNIELVYSAYPFSEPTTEEGFKQGIVERIYSSALNQRLRELTQKENPPFLMAMAGFGSFARGYSGFQAQAIVGKTDIKKATQVLAEEIERIKKYGVTSAEVERIKASILSNLEKSFKEKDKTESENHVAELQRHFLENEPVPGIEFEYELTKKLLAQISIEDVNAISKTLVNNPNFAAAITGPQTAEVSLPSNTELVQIVEQVAQANIKAYEEKVVSKNIFNRVLKPGKIVSKVANAQLGATVYTLSNGIKVTAKHTTYKNDEILLSARRYGGSYNYGIDDKFNVNYLVPVITSMGIGSMAPTEMAKALAGKKGNAMPMFSSITEGFNGTSSVKDFETMLQILNLYVYEPRKDDALFKSFLNKNKQQATFAKANPQAVFVDSAYKTVYDFNPIARTLFPSAKEFDNIKLDRVLEIYKKHFGNFNGMHFTLVGSLPKDSLDKYIEKYIASLPVNKDVKFNYKDNGLRMTKGVKTLTVNKGQEQKSLIMSFYSGDNVAYTPTLNLQGEAIGELLQIKIIEELREKIQGIYSGGISFKFTDKPYTHYEFIAQLPCGPEKVDTLIKALNAEINNLKQNGTTADALNKVKTQWIESHKKRIEENRTWVNYIDDVQVEKENPLLFTSFEKRVNSISLDDIKKAANVLFNGKNNFTAVWLPEKK